MTNEKLFLLIDITNKRLDNTNLRLNITAIFLSTALIGQAILFGLRIFE